MEAARSRNTIGVHTHASHVLETLSHQVAIGCPLSAQSNVSDSSTASRLFDLQQSMYDCCLFPFSCTIILSSVMQRLVFSEWAACVNTDKWPASSRVEPVSRWCQSSIPVVTRGSAS